ncbi:hypothetical protein BC829DRAFT_178945 [Chytridium lagenaria]|nr:hypothetical protein BC829DRAFT_178945 [Chytridium lagenaria]
MAPAALLIFCGNNFFYFIIIIIVSVALTLAYQDYGRLLHIRLDGFAFCLFNYSRLLSYFDWFTFCLSNHRLLLLILLEHFQDTLLLLLSLDYFQHTLLLLLSLDYFQYLFLLLVDLDHFRHSLRLLVNLELVRQLLFRLVGLDHSRPHLGCSCFLTLANFTSLSPTSFTAFPSPIFFALTQFLNLFDFPNNVSTPPLQSHAVDLPLAYVDASYQPLSHSLGVWPRLFQFLFFE